MWIGTYPQDFIQEGAADALSTLLGDLNVHFDRLAGDVMFLRLLPTFPTSLSNGATWHTNGMSIGNAEYQIASARVQQICVKLAFIASIVDSLDNTAIAQEITRVGMDLFLTIEVSHTYLRRHV